MFKRVLDVTVSIILLFLLSPLLLFIALMIRLKLGAPIFFVQKRPGKYGKVFSMVKFRTMLPPSLENNECLSDQDRLTSFGKKLRATSLDELPELWNVLKGEMSLVGPRPLLVEYLPLYSQEQRKRHNVLPGMTGWAQVNGRNSISWEDKFSLDLWYVENKSLWLDIKIIFLTIIVNLFFCEINYI